MSSIKCPGCNLINFATALTCRRCGYFFQEVSGATPNQTQSPASFNEQTGFHQSPNTAPAADYTQQPPPPPRQFAAPHQQDYYRQPPYQAYQPAKLKSGLAIASMVIGIVGFALGCFGGFILAPIGLILGIAALVKTNRRPSEYGGKGFAIAGVASCGFLTVTLPLIMAIAIPNLLAARRAANEASAVSTIRTLSSAEQTYMASMYGKCGDIQALIATKLLDVSLAKNEKSGYRFLIVNLPAGGCEIHATPLTAQGISATGNRSFFYSTEDGEIRAAEKKGLNADANDAPLGSDFPARSESRQKPNEATALATLRTLYGAQATYAATSGQGSCGDLMTLAQEKLISADLADGETGGYRFAVRKLGSNGCDLTATPSSNASQNRSFYAGSDGVIRGKAKNGLPADKSDPPVY